MQAGISLENNTKNGLRWSQSGTESLGIHGNQRVNFILSIFWGQCEESRRDSILKPVHLKDRMWTGPEPCPRVRKLLLVKTRSPSTLHMRWPKYWNFSFSIIPSKEHPGLISLRMDWLDLLAVQGTLNSLLQHDTLKASILRCSAFFTVQLSHPHMTTGKTIALTRWTFVGKVMLLLFNMLPNLVITFLPRSKHLLIS